VQLLIPYTEEIIDQDHVIKSINEQGKDKLDITAVAHTRADK